MKAFPNTRLMQQAVSFDNDEGMDLRDYFAGKAMVALMPIYREMFMDNTFEDWIGDATTAMVDCAYLIADEMMEARNK
jgi:hypothetical protein